MQFHLPLALQPTLIYSVMWVSTFLPTSFSKAVSYICNIVRFFAQSQHSILESPNLLNYIYIFYLYTLRVTFCEASSGSDKRAGSCINHYSITHNTFTTLLHIFIFPHTHWQPLIINYWNSFAFSRMSCIGIIQPFRLAFSLSNMH